ncbi:MAG: hypothetical protein SVK08_01890 [Halobacteriota archaeon]|nr:hypothetical protein [Halobacteriota archaeon]
MLKFKFRDTSGDYLSQGALPGDRFYPYSDSDKKTATQLIEEHDGGYLIWGVEDASTLWLTPVDTNDTYVDFTNPTYAAGTIYYDIKRDLTKNEQAEAIADVAKSYKNKRVYLVWPPTTILSTDEGDVEAESYYACAAVSGLIAGLPPQYPFSGLGISGIKGIKYSNDYFSKTQLDIMAEAGVFILTQANPEALPMIRHQLSTDMDTLEESELSIVKDVDWYSLYCKMSLKKFTEGGYNIYDDTIRLVEGAQSAINEQVVNDMIVPKAGPVMTEADVVAVRANLNGKNEDLPKDEIEVINDVQPPYPVNKIRVRVRI